MRVTLTAVDRQILESYKTLVDGLSEYMGDGYEFVLHSLEDFDHSVIKIINGYYTGRKEGAPITGLALDMLAKIRADSANKGYSTYFSKNKKGEPLKSTTITIRGESGQIIGLLCINLYLNTPLTQFLHNFLAPTMPDMEELDSKKETYAQDMDEVITDAVLEVRQQVYDSDAISAHNRNKEIVHILSQRGVFHFKDAVAKTAKLLGISKNTVYMHLRNA